MFSKLKGKLKRPLSRSRREPDGAVDKNKSNWKPAASATPESILRTVKDSSDVFPPLKSVLGGLCAILENSEVWFTSQSLESRGLQPFQRTAENKQAIESLAPRVKTLAESFCAPIPDDDTQEKARRKILER